MCKRNWSKYNRDLVNRGRISFFIDASLGFNHRQKTRGRPRMYPSSLIQILLILKIQYRLSYRALEGFSNDVLSTIYPGILLPSYSLICRRADELERTLPKLSSRRPSVVLIDATGIKVCGEGAWKVKIHGTSKRRKWIKVHVAVDERTQEILTVEVTDGHIADCTVGPTLIKQCPRSVRVYKADGGYDTRRVRRVMMQRGARSLIPPRRNARLNQDDSNRNKAIQEMTGLGLDLIGRSLWGKLTGYSRRALVETSFARWKKLYGENFFSRGIKKQIVEGNLKSWMLNEMLRKTA